VTTTSTTSKETSVLVVFNFCRKNTFFVHQQLKNVAKMSSSGHVEEIRVKDAQFIWEKQPADHPVAQDVNVLKTTDVMMQVNVSQKSNARDLVQPIRSSVAAINTVKKIAQGSQSLAQECVFQAAFVDLDILETRKPENVSLNAHQNHWYAQQVKLSAHAMLIAKTLVTIQTVLATKNASEAADAHKVNSKTKKENASNQTNAH
jgi:hypothetical protein